MGKWAGLALLTAAAILICLSTAAATRPLAQPSCTSACSGGSSTLKIVFSGSGSATSTTTDQSGGSSSDTDTFSWRAVYELPLSGLSSGSSGTQEDYAASSFTGSASRSCAPPSGGSCVEPGGGTTCQGTFTNNNDVPVFLTSDSPTNGVYPISATAYSQYMSSSGCFPAALQDTCDPLYNSPLRSPITAHFSLDSNDPQTAQPISVSASQPWSCTSSGGESSDTGNIQWKGTVTIGCAGAAAQARAAGFNLFGACCPEPLKLTVEPVDQHRFSAGHVVFDALAGCGRKPYKFDWTRYTQGYWKPKPYVTVTPSAYRQLVKADPATSTLKLTLKCSLPRSKRLSGRHALLACWGPIRYLVRVTDAAGRTKEDQIFFQWQPECLTPEDRRQLRERLREIAREVLNTLENAFADQITGPLTIDKIIKWLEAEEAAPFVLVHDLGEAGVNWAGLQLEAQNIKDQLSTQPDC